MKKTILVLAIAIGASALFAASPAKTAQKGNPPTPEQLAERRAELARRQYAKLGGFVQQPVSGKVIRIVNSQSAVSGETLDSAMKEMRMALDAPVEVVSGANTDANAAVVIVVADEPDAPALLVAPENAWAKVNVAQLRQGNPDQDTLNARTIKEVWRGAAIALGAGYSDFQPDILSLVTTPAELDAVKALSPCPASYNRMIDSATKLGVKRIRTVSYRQACMEGWAPEPKDDIQRAILEEVRQIPDKPIKIEFDPKKGK